MYFLLYSEAHEVALKLLKPVLCRSSGSEVWLMSNTHSNRLKLTYQRRADISQISPAFLPSLWASSSVSGMKGTEGDWNEEQCPAQPSSLVLPSFSNINTHHTHTRTHARTQKHQHTHTHTTFTETSTHTHTHHIHRNNTYTHTHTTHTTHTHTHHSQKHHTHTPHPHTHSLKHHIHRTTHTQHSQKQLGLWR